ncbi:RNA polymerase sigma factor [Streptomyces sp. SD15]
MVSLTFLEAWQLRRHERDVFALCVWSGLSYADAAEALGVPASTVRSRGTRPCRATATSSSVTI